MTPFRPSAADPGDAGPDGGVDADGPAGTGTVDHSAPRIGLFTLIAAVTLLTDVLTKAAVVANLGPSRHPVRLLGGLVYLVQARNSGAAFSLGTGATVVLTLVSVSVAAVIVRTARRLTSAWWAAAFGLVLGGALGNLTDRLLRAPAFARGHVVDWISLFADDGHIWPIFNVADSCIVTGGALAVLLSLRGIDFAGRRTVRGG